MAFPLRVFVDTLQVLKHLIELALGAWGACKLLLRRPASRLVDMILQPAPPPRDLANGDPDVSEDMELPAGRGRRQAVEFAGKLRIDVEYVTACIPSHALADMPAAVGGRKLPPFAKLREFQKQKRGGACTSSSFAKARSSEAV